VVRPRRVALLSVHTSPLEAPGAGDAGGLNVYVVETARRLAQAGVEVEVFTRATTAALPPTVEMAPGVVVHNVTAGPYEGLGKVDLPAQLCAFTAAVLRAEAAREPGWYEAIHSHYWLSGQVGWLARDRWRVPLIHSAHTLAKVKNAALADGEAPESLARIVGEEQVVAEADRLVAPTHAEAAQLIDLYGADPDAVVTVAPGVDLDLFRPDRGPESRHFIQSLPRPLSQSPPRQSTQSLPREFTQSLPRQSTQSLPREFTQSLPRQSTQSLPRQRLGIAGNAVLLLFVGRLQPLKAPDVVIRATAQVLQDHPELTERLEVAIIGAPSGDPRAGEQYLDALHQLAASLGLTSRVRFAGVVPRTELADWYRAADLTVVPSYSESFGLVALESQACGTPVVAADVGGLTTAVANGRSGVLVSGHSGRDWGRIIGDLVSTASRRHELARGALEHAARFSWDRTTSELLVVYEDAMADFAAHRERIRL
jgi:D-inositol-3-phosphate glycosyltransferase